ncbi:MAG: response regulator [Methylococcales bacterium]|nr:response regulator [Methylococcales bacterium]
MAAVLEARYSALNRWVDTQQAQISILAVAPTTVKLLGELSAEFQHLGDNAQVLLQQNYLVTIHDNQNAQKQGSIEAYDKIFRIAQSYFSRRYDAFGWEDMFLIDTHGNLVFSVKNETDFATNLRAGPWRDSGLARAVIPLLKDAIPNQLSFADYSPYTPSKMQAASFIAMPVFDEQKQQFLGVIAIQLPVAKLNELMMDKTGMGETGEVILINKDSWMLTDSRFSKDSTVLKRQLDAQPSKIVLAGKTATLITPDYRGIDVLVSVKPFTPFSGALGDKVRWGLIAKIEYTEVLLESYELQHTLVFTAAGLIVLAVGLGMWSGVGLGMWSGRTITLPLSRIADALTRLANGEQVDVPELQRTDEIGEIAKAAEAFYAIAQQVEHEHWISEHITQLTSAVTAESSVNKAAARFLHLLCDLLTIPVGAVYLLEECAYQRVSTYGLARSNQADTCFEPGIGILGQCAKSNQAIVLSPVPAGLIIISTGLAEFAPHELVIFRIEYKNEVLVVVELAVTTSLQPKYHAFLKSVSTVLGLYFFNLQVIEHNALLLVESRQLSDESQRRNEEMQAQAEELRSQSEEMKSQNEELKCSQEELRAQQEETLLKNKLLETQSKQLKDAISEAKVKTEELQRSNQYKSEFLANMSHELRTPLNSILILSRSLAENEEHNLSTDQIESASVISESGAQLLTLINDILDLSKIEAGKLELVKEAFSLQDMMAYLQRVFLPQAEKKNLAFTIETADDLPNTMFTDKQRLIQILSNLLTNAIKFTDIGSVKVLISKIGDDCQIEIVDTGIGIPVDKLEHIFGAFQQLDGSTSRKYGGSGLGLAISRTLTQLLGGEISVTSTIGQGSRFMLRLKKVFASLETKYEVSVQTPPVVAKITTASTGNILLVEDDARLLVILGRMITALGFTVITAESAEQALEVLTETKLTGILLDLGLPKMSGMELLRHLKANKTTAKIPVFIMSGAIDTGEAKTRGALGFLKKPVTRDNVIDALKTMVQITQDTAVPQILLIEDNPIDRQFVESLLSECALDIIAVEQGGEALQILQTQSFAVVILDLQLPDISGFDWLKQAQQYLNPPPIIIYSARELTENEVFELKGVTESIVTKDASSVRLREEVLYALHQTDRAIAVYSEQITGKKLLLVDDDARNLYALTKVLRSKGFIVEVAPDSIKALERLAQTGFDVMLTDIMMPEVDGYELIRRVRALGYDKLPIIAITAKAMQGDDTLCLQAGANAYLAKPVDVNILIELVNKLS